MVDDDDHGCGNVGRWVAVLCAALGVGTAFLWCGPWTSVGSSSRTRVPKEIVVRLVVLFIASASGKKARIYLCDKTYDLALNVLVGLGLAFGSIAAAVLAATIVGFLGEADHILRAENFSASGLVLGLFFRGFSLYGLAESRRYC